MRPMALLALAAVLAAIFAAVTGRPGPVRAAEEPVHLLWRADPATGFGDWTLAGVAATPRGLLLADRPAPAAEGAERAPEAAWPDGLSRPDGRSGLAVGPIRSTEVPFRELIPSWNVETPPGSWIEVRLRARLDGDDGRWTRWYELGVWGTDAGPERRLSVKGQRDADGQVSTDTLALSAPAGAYQLALILRSDAPAGDPGPLVTLAAVLASAPSPHPRAVPPSGPARGTVLDVPERSQMAYPGGGPVWCSPTSTSMVLAYWAERIGQAALDRPVPEVAAAVYDPVYRGNGNWPFNTAYAGAHGLTAYVSRMSSLGQVERWIEAGIPVVASLAWDPGELGPAAAVPSTDGHLLVIVGFTAEGDVVVNDPAADPRLGLAVRRVYPRAALERLWLTHSGGTVYLIYPTGSVLPSAEAAFGAW